ncbi:MAG: IS66 family transposase [Deltaproteobacteria bacterium]|nr:IS66 family transposase [Deltaproteobacteria bacterium]
MQQRLDLLEKRTEKLEAQTKKNSQNSSKPPSSDSPFNKPKKKTKKRKRKRGAQKGRKRGAQKGHKGHQQQMLEPTKIENIIPEGCDCGRLVIDPDSIKPFYTHQHIELPEIKVDVTHYILNQGKCKCCGKTVKAKVPSEFSSGYGPRLSAVIAELSGSHGASRETVQDFCHSVLGFPISTGGIQRVIDRTSQAIEPIYNEIGDQARKAKVNGVDETSWFQSGKLQWLWTMANNVVAFFMIHPNRSKEAFLQLIDDWKGILISDDYGVYVNWVNKRQRCLAHFIRKAKGLAERENESIKAFGENILKELRLLCHWAKKPPDQKQWANFYSRFLLLLMLYEGADNDAGQLARSIGKELESLWVFLDENGVEPTNNRSERALRFAVLWRKRSNGTQSDKGNRWVERILSLKQTCRMRALPVFPILVNAIDAYFKDQTPNLQWVAANY